MRGILISLSGDGSSVQQAWMRMRLLLTFHGPASGRESLPSPFVMHQYVECMVYQSQGMSSLVGGVGYQLALPRCSNVERPSNVH